jgi:hypothetical protein
MKEQNAKKVSPWKSSPVINLDKTRFIWEKNHKRCRGQGFLGFDVVHQRIVPCSCLKFKEQKMSNVSGLKDAPDLIQIIKNIFGNGKKKEEPAPIKQADQDKK